MASSTDDSSVIIDISNSKKDIEEQVENWEWFIDAFDILDEYDDLLETTDYNQQQYKDENLQEIIEEYNENFDFELLHTNLNEEDMSTTIDETSIMTNQEILSQKLSQLSTEHDDVEQTSNTKKRSRSLVSISDEIQNKKRRTWNDHKRDQQEELEDYFEQLDEIFNKKMTDHVIQNNIVNFNMEDVRDLATIQHKIATARLHRELCFVYLKLGLGQWKTNETISSTVNRCMWTKLIKNLVSSHHMTTDNKLLNEHVYEQCVQEQINILNRKILQYKKEYNEKKTTSQTQITIGIEQEIERFVQQFSVIAYETKFKHKMTLVQYEYDDELLLREFLQYNPTEEQIQLTQTLYDLRYSLMKTKYETIELQKRVLFNKPPQLIHAQALSLIGASPVQSNTDPFTFQKNIDSEEKKLATTMMDLIGEQIIELENKTQHYRDLFNQNMDKILVRTTNNNEGLDSRAVDIFYRRLNIINNVLDCKSRFRSNYFFRYHYERLASTTPLHKIRFPPSTIMRTAFHLFSDEQLRLLNRGPTYIPIYQTFSSLPSTNRFSALQDKLTGHFKVLQHDLSRLYAKLNINPAQSMFLTKKIKDLYINTFSNYSIPIIIRQRAIYEKHLIESIDEQLKKYDLILRRTADQRNVFYLCNRQEFHEQTCEYMNYTDDFEHVCNIDENNLEETRTLLARKVRSLNENFDEIFQDKKKFKDILQSIYISNDKVELPYVYFLPDVSREHEHNLSLVPIIVTPRSMNSRLAKFLNQLLHPFIQKYTESTTLRNGSDFIEKLLNYIKNETQQNSRLQSTTQFVTIKILNYSTMATHNNMLIALQDFTQKNTILPILNNIPLAKLYRLVTLFLNSNFFYFNHKIYTFVKGAPTSFPLTDTLNHMYLNQWERKLLQKASMKDEFYGRCRDEIFFTWNRSMDEFNRLKLLLEQDAINLRFDININTNARFLGAYLENRHGTLYSRVDHDIIMQNYTLPYVLHRPIQAHSHWLRSALIRAVHYCTSVHDFNRERIYLELTCFSNGYSLHFVDERVQHFFKYFNASSLRICSDQDVYDQLRKRLMNFIKEQQTWLEHRHECEKKNQRIYTSYFYEYGPKRKFQQDLTAILTPHIEASTLGIFSAAINKPKLILRTKQYYSLNALLSKQKPSHPLLK